MNEEICNAVITSASLSNADHGMLSSFLMLDYGHSGQGFGGFALYNPRYKDTSGNYAGHWIWRILEVTETSDWSQLKGKNIRAKIKNGRVIAIGHIIKDNWFNPEDEFSQIP